MKVVCNGSAELNCWKRKGDIVDKTILLKNASLLTEDAKCVQNQNLYVRDGKILRMPPKTAGKSRRRRPLIAAATM